MVPIDSEHDIQSDTPGAIPRGVLSQCGGDVRDAHSEVHPHRRIEALSSVCTRTRLGESRVLLLAILPPPVIAQFPQVKLRLPEPDVNGRFDWRDDLCVSKGDTEHTEQRADHGAVTLWLHSLGQQQAHPGAILPHWCALLSFDGSHRKNLPVHAVDTSRCSLRAYVTLLPLKTARAYAESHR
jgi:hypothetical protein